MSDMNESVEEAAELAKENGFEIVMGDDLHLLLDLDTQDDIDFFRKQYDEVFQEGTSKDYWTSKSGRGRHVVIELFVSTPIVERIAMQAALGSDRKRELLALMRVKEGVENPIMLFRPKATKVSEVNEELAPDVSTV